MLKQDTLTRLQTVFENVTGRTGFEVRPEMTIDKDLKVNSLSKIQLICSIEDEFEIEVPNKLLKKLKKVSDLYEFLESQGL